MPSGGLIYLFMILLFPNAHLLYKLYHPRGLSAVIATATSTVECDSSTAFQLSMGSLQVTRVAYGKRSLHHYSS